MRYLVLLLLCLVGCGVNDSDKPQGAAARTAIAPHHAGHVELSAQVGEVHAMRDEKEPTKVRFTFPYQLPDSTISIGKDVVDEVNELRTKGEQIDFLSSMLPPPDQISKTLSDKQLYAIRLLSITDSDAAITPLLNALGFTHREDRRPAGHGLARLGERSVEPLVEKLRQATDRETALTCAEALMKIKKKSFSGFIEELKRREDGPPSDVINILIKQDAVSTESDS